MAVNTGLSDCHKMKVAVIKSQYEKLKPKLISHRKYNNFSNDIFKVMVIEKIQEWNMQDKTLDILKQIFLDIPDKLAPLKHRYIRANQVKLLL